MEALGLAGWLPLAVNPEGDLAVSPLIYVPHPEAAGLGAVTTHAPHGDHREPRPGMAYLVQLVPALDAFSFCASEGSSSFSKLPRPFSA